jgi:hypothetical protein
VAYDEIVLGVEVESIHVIGLERSFPETTSRQEEMAMASAQV